MKRVICSLLVIICIFIPLGCSNKNVKPSLYYYTNILAKHVKEEPSYKVSVTEKNFYKNKLLSKEDSDSLKGFISSLKGNNFITVPKDGLPQIKYRMIVTFPKEKYVINLYDKSLVTVHPYDGTYDMDYLDISKLPDSYNLYKICEYIFNGS